VASVHRYVMTALILILVVFVLSCGKKGSPTIRDTHEPAANQSQSLSQSATSNSDAPSTDELEALLRAELARLGVDIERAVAKAPTGTENKVFDLAATVIDPDGPAGPLPPEGVTLSWTERLIGDCDQSGEVGISDITPIAMNYQAQVNYDDPAIHGGIEWWPTGDPDDDGGTGDTPSPGSGAENWRLSRIDSDASGEIGVPDITPIANHYLERLDGYRVYRKGPGDVEFTMIGSPDDPGSPLTIPRESTFQPGETAPDANRPVRYRFTDSSSTEPGAYFYKVAPFDTESGAEGEASNVVAVIIGEPDNYPPEWTEDMDEPVTQGRDCRIIVGWPSAVDPNGDEVTYSTYYDDYPIPPADYAGTLDEWLALACEPVSSTFKPIYDEETDTWSDESVTPAVVLPPDDPRILALNPTRKLDDVEAGTTHDEIPLQVVGGLPEGSRLNERDWAYVENQPGGFPPEPGTNKTWVRQDPITNVTAIPDYVSPTVLTYYDGYTTEDSIPASEPNMRERGRYYVAVAAVDDKGAHSALIKTSSFVIASAFFAVPLESQFAPKRIMRNSCFKSNTGNIFVTFEIYPQEGESGDLVQILAKYDPAACTFDFTEVDRSATYVQLNGEVVHEFDDGSVLVFLHQDTISGNITSELILVKDGIIERRENIKPLAGDSYFSLVAYIDNKVVLLYGCTEYFSPTHSWPLIMRRGYFGDWDEPEQIEEKTWGFTVGGIREDRADIAIAVHKAELGDSSFEKPQYIRAIRINGSGYEELYKNVDEAGFIFNTFENGSILRVSDRQMLTQEDATYTTYYFFTDTARPPVDDYLESLERGYQEKRRLWIACSGSLATIIGDLSPILRQSNFLSQDPTLTDRRIADCNANAIFSGAFLDESEPDVYSSGEHMVFTMF